MVPVTTALYAAANALLNITLASRVSHLRGQERVSLGHGESKVLLVAARAHGNNAEYVPLALVMLLLAELCGGSSLWLHVLGGSLFVARLAHAVGLARPAPNVLRVLGTGVSWFTIVATSIWVLVLRGKS